MICPQCQHENRPTAKFCEACGGKLPHRCTACGAELRPTARFCDECGAARTGAGGPPAAAAAPSLRAPSLEEGFTTLQRALPSSLRHQLFTPQEGENRPVTILFADMSRSMQTTAHLPPDEAADLVSQLLKLMVDVLLKYEGRVDRFLGDGLLAVFGAPRARESDPERAILAALEIRAEARKRGLEVTAGINTGEVYVGGVGSERHQEVTVMGPTVNLASRLQGQAEPGQILVGEATHRHTRRAFAFSPVSLTVKGIPEPIQAYRVERALPRPEKARGIEGLRAELIGRESELGQLQDALAAVLRGHGQWVSLIGEAGLGKSRLVAELKAVAQPSRDRQGANPSRDREGAEEEALPHGRGSTPLLPLWLEGRCLELGMSASYWLFVDLFRHYFGFAAEDEEQARAGRLVRGLEALIGDGGLSRERVEEIGPLFGRLLSVRFGTEWDERLAHTSPEQVKHQTFMAVRDFFAALARRQPVVLVLEDLHWADSLSLDLIAALMESLTRDALLLLGVYRPERDHPCVRLGNIVAEKCAGRATEITLRELTPEQSRHLVEALLMIENLPSLVKTLILEKAHGNPFFVEEVVRSLIDSGMVYEQEGVWRARDGIESLTVPASIQSVIMSRVDRLEREPKAVLESAAVIGRLFPRRLLEQVVARRQTPDASADAGRQTPDAIGMDSTSLATGDWRLASVLRELEHRQLIYHERLAPEEEYSFQHVLTQETVYGSIVRRRRPALHQQVAEAIEALYTAGLDEYYERSGLEEKTIGYLLRAGEKAQRAYLNDAAIDYLQRALERLEALGPSEKNTAWQLETLQRLGQVYHRMGRETGAEKCLRQAIAIGQAAGLSTRELVRLYYWLGETLWWQSRFAEVVKLGEAGLALLGDDTRSTEAALMNQHIAIGGNGMGDSQRWREFTHRTAEFLKELPYSEELRPAYSHVVQVCAYEDGNVSEAMCWLQAMEHVGQEHHDLRMSGTVHTSAGRLLAATGDASGAASRYQQSLELSRRMGTQKTDALSQLGASLLAQGDLQQGRHCMAEALAILDRVGMKRDSANCRINLGIIAMCQGDWQEAATLFHQAAELHQAIGWSGDRPRLLLGRVVLAQGDLRGAREQFEEALAHAGDVPPDALSGLEEACGNRQAFAAFCRRFQEEHPAARGTALVHWFLEPDQPSRFARRGIQDHFSGALSSSWTWEDPFGDCAFRVGTGLVIEAANERGLSYLNRSAPRLMMPLSEDFAAVALCGPASAERPAVGGLLLWKDERHYLRLDRGTRGKHEVSFQGCLANQDTVIGRGRLVCERIFLRLERRQGQVKALCSADGNEWLTAGQVEFPVEDPVQIGLHAMGQIDRTIYPGAYPEGTAIRFEWFEVWR